MDPEYYNPYSRDPQINRKPPTCRDVFEQAADFQVQIIHYSQLLDLVLVPPPLLVSAGKSRK